MKITNRLHQDDNFVMLEIGVDPAWEAEDIATYFDPDAETAGTVRGCTRLAGLPGKPDNQSPLSNQPPDDKRALTVRPGGQDQPDKTFKPASGSASAERNSTRLETSFPEEGVASVLASTRRVPVQS